MSIGTPPFTIVVKTALVTLFPFEKDETTIKITIAIRSCTSKNPIDILPYNLSRASLSERSFIIIIVDENESAVATYIDVIEFKPSANQMKYPTKDVNTTCPIPVISEILPTSFIILGLKCNPTINKRRVIPNSEKTEIASLYFNKLRNKGPIRIPEIIYPIINGCLSIRIINETAKTIASIMLI